MIATLLRNKMARYDPFLLISFFIDWQISVSCFVSMSFVGFFCWHCHTTSHSTTPQPMKSKRRRYTVVTLLNDLHNWPHYFWFKWKGWEQIIFSLAKRMTIIHIAFTWVMVSLDFKLYDSVCWSKVLCHRSEICTYLTPVWSKILAAQ